MLKKKKIIVLGPFPPPISGVSLANQVLVKGLKKNDWSVSVINTEYSKNLTDTHGKLSLEKLYFFFKYFSFWKILNKDIVFITIGQSFFGVIKYFPFIIFSKFTGTCLVVHLHGGHLLNEYNKLNGVKKTIFKKTISMFDYAIVLSKSLRVNFQPFLSEEKIFELNNFFEDSLIISEDELLKQKEFSELRLVFLSNLIEEKGINVLLKALKNLNNNGLKIKLIIAGNKVKENDLSKYLEDLSFVEYAGVLYGKEKQKLLTWGNVFCLPTFYKMEGQPISIIEAMSMGNLILTTNHSGIPDICKDDNAVFCKKNDVDDITNKLEFLYNNLNIVKEKSLINIKYAREVFTEKKFSYNVNEILKKCLN
jgi:glycosyltransferase involved in cell wall biosynthesis